MQRSLYPLLSLLQLTAVATHCGAANSGSTAILPEKHRALLKTHCQNCHGSEKQKGKFRVDDLSFSINDIPSAERWQKIINALNSGEMPPEEEKQPTPALKADFLDDLAHTLVSARRTLSDQHGMIALRRLNRREYKNTLRDLLGVDIDVSELPADTRAGGFDTVGANLFLSASQLDSYEALAREALEEAFLLQTSAGTAKKLRFEAESTLATFIKHNRETYDDYARATAWVKAVNDAIARPQNAAVITELRKDFKSDESLRHAWARIPGAPPPALFGLDNVHVIHGFAMLDAFVAYELHYLQMPGLDTGAYLTLPYEVRSRRANNAIQLYIPTDWPPGDYMVRFRVGATPEAPEERRYLEFGIDHREDQSPFLSTHHITGTREEPQIIEVPYRISQKFVQGRGRFFVRERGAGNFAKSLAHFREMRAKNGVGPDLSIWVDWFEIERIPRTAARTPLGIRALGALPLDDQSPPPPKEQLRSALERFALEANRGIPTQPGTTDRLLGIYETGRLSGLKHRAALKDTLTAVLTSPGFLYRAEPEAQEQHRRLAPIELASRLSYFLNGAPPDPLLQSLAASGKLSHPESIRSEADRLLADPRSKEFVEAFLSQWLNLERLDFFQFNQTLYPRFDNNTKAAARNEVIETFAHLLRHDRPLTDLLKADYVIVNSLLSSYYGIEGVQGDDFRKVALSPGSPRGGLLGMAAVLAMGSNGERTNPVERGAWVLRKLLNDPPPPAPANVPEINRLAGKLLTTRERLQAHQDSPQCASCHRKIDPLGFGLENFDAVGQWRTQDSYTARDASGNPDPKTVKTWTIEAAATLHKGPSFQNFQQMRVILATKKEAFARGFTAALIEYALGRPCGFSDEPLVDAIVNQASRNGYATRAFIHALLQSQAFQTK